jgi:1-acyl-sn-glycerol-3-phosphate acyltransferase
VDDAPDEALDSFLREFARVGDEYRFYPAHPFGRALSRLFMGVLTPTCTVEGGDNLARFLGGPGRRLVICNHLSYTDTQLTDSILARAGHEGLADRLVAVAGPKVYTEAWRRLAAMSLNTRKTVQSSHVATEQDALSPRDIARIALETVSDCERLMDDGYVVLLYPEGTRSRNRALQPFLRALSRYTAIPDLRILVMAQTGSEAIFPIDDGKMHPGPVRVAFAEPFAAADFPAKGAALVEAHARLSALLPPDYRPPEGQPAIA